MSMTKAELDTWIAALRSGEYDQCHEDLSTYTNQCGEPAKHAYCCIGVAMEVLKPGGETCETATHEDEDPTNFAIDRLGIPYITSNKLVSMNDQDKLPFPKIADWIDANRHEFD